MQAARLRMSEKTLTVLEHRKQAATSPADASPHAPRPPAPRPSARTHPCVASLRQPLLARCTRRRPQMRPAPREGGGFPAWKRHRHWQTPARTWLRTLSWMR